MRISQKLSGLLMILLLLCPLLQTALPEITGELRNFLVMQIRLKENEMQRISVGECFVKNLSTEERDELAVFGIIYIAVPPDFFMNQFRNITKFESGKRVFASGMFSNPPQLTDVSQLSWEPDDLEEIRKCDPNGCESRIPGGSISLIQKKVDWTSPQAMEKANELMRRLVIEYVANYQRIGDDALTSYLDGERHIPVKEGLQRLLRQSPYVHHYVPELASHLYTFPRHKSESAEDFFYWQKFEFGLQPVIRINHVVIFKKENSDGMEYTIASKMLYANHYFRDGLEFRSLVPDQRDPNRKGFYLIVLNRSHADGMTGWKGFLIRNTIITKVEEALKQWLMKTKWRMETNYENSR
jgi:hypothetical protein